MCVVLFLWFGFDVNYGGKNIRMSLNVACTKLLVGEVNWIKKLQYVSHCGVIRNFSTHKSWSRNGPHKQLCGKGHINIDLFVHCCVPSAGQLCPQMTNRSPASYLLTATDTITQLIEVEIKKVQPKVSFTRVVHFSSQLGCVVRLKHAKISSLVVLCCEKHHRAAVKTDSL